MKAPHNSPVRTLAIIPARGNSKGIPGKNIADMCGRPLIWYSIREAHKAKLLDATIVSTDDEEIAQVACDLGADVPFLRPAEFARDDSRDVEFLQHALDWVEHEREWKPDIVLFLPPTSPSRTADDIDTAIQLMDSSGADSVRTMVHPPHWNPYKMWKDAGGDGRVEPLFESARGNVPRQELSTWYMPVAIAYATRVSCIKEGRVWGKDVRAIKFPLDRFTDIDTSEDLVRASEVLQKFNLV